MAITPDFSVAGKHVLITGGTGRIGALLKSLSRSWRKRIVPGVEPPKDGTEPPHSIRTAGRAQRCCVEALAAGIEKLDVVIHCAGRVAPWEEYKPDLRHAI